MAVRDKTQFMPDEIYFITFTICNWEKVFINDKYASVVYKWFDYLRSECGNKVFAYCIMPNHVHAIIRVSDRSPVLSRLIQNAKRVMGFQLVKMLREDGNYALLDKFSEYAIKIKGSNYRVF